MLNGKIRRHVFRDLRPYTCTFAKCTNPDKLYATRREWIYHEMQMHRRQWSCRSCHDHFTTKQLMSSHLQTAHAHMWNQEQLSTLLEVSEGPADEAVARPCTFCGDEHSGKHLMAHIAGHLEELSLFVLPRQGTQDPPAEESSGILSSLDSAMDDISYYGEEVLLPQQEVLPQEVVQDENLDFSLAGYQTPLSAGLTEGTPYTSHTISDMPTISSGDRSSDPVTAYVCDQCGRFFDQFHKFKSVVASIRRGSSIATVY